MFLILMMSLTMPMSTWTVPLLLTAVTVYGPLYAAFAYLADWSPLTMTLSPILY